MTSRTPNPPGSGAKRRRDGDPPRPSAFRLERLLRQAHRDPDGPRFAADLEFADWLEAGGEAPLTIARKATVAVDPRERAQDLAFDAYELPATRALAAARRALKLDPACTDARVIKACVTSGEGPDLIMMLEQILTDTERELGDDFFERAAGDYWALVPARPYLRAARQLAELLWDAGYRLDSVSWYEHLMELDPCDHSGNAPLLVGDYLAMGEVQRAWDLLEQFDPGDSSVMAWAWVLLQLLVDDEEAARTALDRAMALNPYAATGLLGLGDELVPEITPFVAAGSQAEANVCEQILGEAWDRAPYAQDWLEDVLERLGLLDGDPDDDGPGAAPPPLRIVN
jgi:tetratricopeptide (TPR) repeat protein